MSANKPPNFGSSDFSFINRPTIPHTWLLHYIIFWIKLSPTGNNINLQEIKFLRILSGIYAEIGP
jgi:hypothetical protein